MSRFEIEDIVSQDRRGIVFRAHDSEKGHTVSLRRFFPFGQDGGGLEEDEAVAFRLAAQRLAGVTHPALRTIFGGAVDPIDKLPYMVAEWIDGAKLTEMLGGDVLDSRLVIHVIQLALEVSMLLSETLGEEAIWVETESIFVGTEESGRGFVFWLSPFKWLGAEIGGRNLAALVDMGERLAGWKGKHIGDHDGQGLGELLKWMTSNPDASIAQTLNVLPDFVSDGNSPPPPKSAFTTLFESQRARKMKMPTFAAPLKIAACAGLLLAVGGLVHDKFAEKISKTPPTVTAPSLPDFTPSDGAKMNLLKANASASVTGVVLNVRLSSTGNSLYFEFSNPTNASEIMVVAHKNSYQGDFNVTTYRNLIGKRMRFDGTVSLEPGGCQYVKISSREQMKPVH